jgi:hypothetical protein
MASMDWISADGDCKSTSRFAPLPQAAATATKTIKRPQTHTRSLGNLMAVKKSRIKVSPVRSTSPVPSKNKLISSSKATGSGQADHIKNFIEAIRADAPTMLNQPILSGHQSALLCHLGNTAHRTNRVISTQSTDGRWLDETIPKTHWRREYDPKWEKEIAL